MTALQLISVLNRVAGLVPHDSRELITRAPFDIEHLTPLESNEPRMREIEGNRETRHALRRKPFLGEPDVRANTKSAALERLVERIYARLQPGPFYSKAKVLDAELKQPVVGPGGPGESSFHGRCEYAAPGPTFDRGSAATDL